MNMNGDYVLSKTLHAPKDKDFPTNFMSASLSLRIGEVHRVGKSPCCSEYDQRGLIAADTYIPPTIRFTRH